MVGVRRRLWQAIALASVYLNKHQMRCRVDVDVTSVVKKLTLPRRLLPLLELGESNNFGGLRICLTSLLHGALK